MTQPEPGEIRAGIYCRISVAATGDMTKTDDQERICRDRAQRLGWPVTEGIGCPRQDGVYTDHSKSAWQPNRKRPAWDQMLADIDAGKINALVVFHGDRLIGRPEDLSTLLQLSRSRGIRITSPSGDRDLDNPDDEFILWIEAAMKGRESANLSRRRKAQYVRWRLEGKVRHGGRGGRAFGFETDGITHMPPDRCDIATREEIGEIGFIREAAARILAGESTAAVAGDMGRRGITTPAGNPISNGTLTKMLGRPRYAGLMPDRVSKAAWKPVLPRETWEMLQSELAIRSARVHAPSNRAKYLLSGIAECGVCHKPLQISGGHSGPPHHKGYRCYAGCRVSRDQPLLDAYVVARVVARLNHPGNPQGRIPEAPDLASEFASLTDAQAEAAAAIADPSKGGYLSLLLARLERIERRLAELREMAGDARARLLTKHAGISYEEFLAEPLSVQRALVAACFEVVVLPASARGPGFRTEDVRLTPR